MASAKKSETDKKQETRPKSTLLPSQRIKTKKGKRLLLKKRRETSTSK
jgi:hypothetical protein